MKRLSTFALLSALSAAASVTAPAFAIEGSHECPCGPRGMVTEKYSCPLDNGGKLKLYCTNESKLGNFAVVYCGPDGGAGKVIGGCIFEGGQNDTEIIPGPDGKPCFIVHTNTDGGRPDGADWDKVVWVFNVKTCQDTVYCFKDGRQVGDPACYGPEWFREHPWVLERASQVIRDFLEFTFGPIGKGDRDDSDAAGQKQSELAVAKVDVRGGTRHLRFLTGDTTIRVRAGDRVMLTGARAVDLFDVNPNFVVLPDLPVGGLEGVDAGGADPATSDRPSRDRARFTVLAAVSDFTLTNDAHLATVTDANRDAIRFEMLASDNAQYAERLAIATWRDWPQPEIPGVRRLNSYGEIDGAFFVVDVNGDRSVDLKDISQIIMNWGTGDISCDVNEDGLVGFEDLTLVLGAWPDA